MERALELTREEFPFRELTADDVAMYVRYEPETVISCRGFISQYAYTDEDCIRVLEDSVSGGLLTICMDERNRLCAYPPLGQLSEEKFHAGVRRLLEFFALTGEEALFTCVEERELRLFETFEGRRAEIGFDVNEDDYVYSVYRLTHFDGSENHQRRQSRGKFLRRHALEFYLNGDVSVDDLAYVSGGWCEFRGCEQCGYRCPHDTMMRVIKVADRIGARVILMKMDGVPEALIVTGSMGGGCEDLLSICNRTRVEGLTYAFLERACLDAFPEAELLNLEEDLGLPQLRHFKQQLKPIKMVHKYYVRLCKL